MPRLFTGLEIPPEAQRELAALRGGLSGARWIDPENYHITLRFIGDIDAATARDVLAVLGEGRQPGEIAVTIGELGSFGNGKPHAVVAKAAANPVLVALQAEQERLVRRIGLPAETRKFVPHVTLARLRGTSALGVADYIGTFGHFPKISFTARRFVLFSSRNSVGGGPYVVEAAYPLAR